MEATAANIVFIFSGLCWHMIVIFVINAHVERKDAST